MAMTADENSESEFDTEEPPFEKITINTYYKIKTSLEEPLTDEPSFLPMIISSQLSAQNKSKLVSVLKKHKEAFAWKTTDIPEVVKKEIMKLLDTGIIYPIADSPWVSPIHCVPKKGGITVVTNENNELVPTRTITGWRCCKDAHLVLNWEKCHFMVKEGIVLGHKVSSAGLEVDKAKINVISKLPPLLISKVLEAFLDMSVFTEGSLKISQKFLDL
ncbi:hypothetical protein Tco_1569992 [Tanacetum coccineum]